MITKLHLYMESLDEVKAQQRSYTGFLLRGLIYTLLRTIDSQYAEQLHLEKGVPASFSLKPPFAIVQQGIRVYTLRIPEKTAFTVEVGVLKNELAEFLCKALVNNHENNLTLAQAKIKLLSLSIDQIPSENLRKNTFELEKFSVYFITPTFFRIHIPRGIRRAEQVRVLPLPDPMHMFTNLYNIWNAYLKPKIGEDYLEWLQQHSILISRLKNIKTHRYYEHPVKGVFAIGFTGTAYYTLAEDTYDEKMARITHQLLKMAEYTNVGGNRTAGYGWITFKAFPLDESREVSKKGEPH